jgi:serine/threonine-protein kinase
MPRPDPELDLLSFGLPDAVVSALAGLPSVVVRSPLAAAKHAGDDVDLGAIADALAVDAIVTGTLVRAGDQVRVSAQMLEVPSGTILCSRTVQQGIGDIFAIQDQLAEALAEALATPAQRTVLRHDVPRTARAYELYLRANHVSYDTSMLPVAEQLYRLALAEDPEYAPAWARLGRVYRLLAKYGEDHEAEAHLQRAGDAFTRAMTLDPNSTVAHNLYTAFEVESQGHAVDATVRLIGQLRNRPDPELFAGLVLSCRFCGLLDASVAADRQVRRLDPAIRTSVMYTHFARGDWEQAIATDVEDARWVTRYALLVLGRRNEAIASFRETEERPLPVLLRRLMMVSRLALEGRREECVATSRAFTGGRAFDPEGLYFAARALAYIDEPALALSALEQVLERGYACPSLLSRDPWLDSVRAEARFAALVARAETLSREASAAFRRAGGEQLLGVTA